MLFCPYCGRREKPSTRLADFTDIPGFSLTDNPNKKKLALKVHSDGCGRVFIALFDTEKNEYVACFRLPREGWVRAIFSRSQV